MEAMHFIPLLTTLVLVDSLYQQLQQATHPSQRLQYALALAQYYEKKQPDSAIYFSKIALQNAKDDTATFKIYKILGTAFLIRYQIDSAEFYLKKALQTPIP